MRRRNVESRKEPAKSRKRAARRVESFFSLHSLEEQNLAYNESGVVAERNGPVCFNASVEAQRTDKEWHQPRGTSRKNNERVTRSPSILVA